MTGDRQTRERALELFNDSLARCRGLGDLAGAFYERFLAVPGVWPHFARTDFGRQRRVLTSSLYRLMEAANGRQDSLEHLEQLARGHAALGIPAETYGAWLACMLETVAALDPMFDEDVYAAWRAVLHPGIAVMVRHARERHPAAGDAEATPGGRP
jgi:hemoglobin-like flavoprotein